MDDLLIISDLVQLATDIAHGMAHSRWAMTEGLHVDDIFGAASKPDASHREGRLAASVGAGLPC